MNFGELITHKYDPEVAWPRCFLRSTHAIFHGDLPRVEIHLMR